jgi:hypothetical protein
VTASAASEVHFDHESGAGVGRFAGALSGVVEGDVVLVGEVVRVVVGTDEEVDPAPESRPELLCAPSEDGNDPAPQAARTMTKKVAAAGARSRGRPPLARTHTMLGRRVGRR